MSGNTAVKNDEEAAQFHAWMSLTTNLLIPQVDGKLRPTFDAEPILKWIRAFARKLRRRLQPWATHDLRDEDAKELLRSIVSAAVALDLKMQRQRAEYRYVRLSSGSSGAGYGFSFCADDMISVNIQSDESSEEDLPKHDLEKPEKHDESGKRWPKRVELVLAPALETFDCRNDSGLGLKKARVVVKAQVSCKRVESRKARAPRPGLRARLGLRG